MMQIVKQTHEEKMAMYMKLPKKELAKMQIECNRLLDNISQHVSIDEFPGIMAKSLGERTMDMIENDFNNTLV